jgi:hypothetical protein
MERPGKFDQEIRNKMLPLEDEPSAAVWAGIRGEIGPAIPASSAPWVYRIMVAASVALLVGLAFMLVQKNQREVGQIAKNAPDTTVTPQRPNQIKQNFAMESIDSADFRKADKQPWYGPAYPKVKSESDSDQIAEENDGEPIPEYRNAPEINRNQEQIVEQTPNVKEEKPLPDMIPAPIDKKKEVFANNETPEGNGRKGKNRKIRLPKSDELTLENLKNKSKGILGSLASGARDYLGIDTKYEQEDKENLRTTAFSANFGLFKVKKVQTVKKKNP